MKEEKILLRAEGINKEFPGVKALSEVSFALKRGEVHALLGENGAGKSTLIKVLTGVEHRDSGSIWMEGQEISPKNTQEAQAVGISTVYQEVNLCPNLSVAENIYIGRQIRKNGRIDWQQMNKNAKEMLERFNLNISVTRNLEEYSVAIQQMVAIARAVDISAKVLILDEPTSSLSTVEVEKLFDIMRQLKAQGIGIVFVTHFLDQVYEISDTATVLRNGGYVGTYAVKDLPRVELVGKMIGKEYAELEKTAAVLQAEQGPKDTIIELKSVDTNGKLHDISFTVNRGEVLGLSGLLGSGRSETARALFGVDTVEKGEYSLNNVSVKMKSPLMAIRNNLAFCPENRKTEGIVGDLSLRDNIILALQAKRGMFKKISRTEADSISKNYIEKLAIKTPSANQLIRNLSGGNQQKVILARWLATDPELLILDEPTRGIDIGTKAEIQKIVIQLAADGMAVIFISSEIDEMLRCCKRMIVLRDKMKVAELADDNISENRIMEYIAGGAANGEK